MIAHERKLVRERVRRKQSDKLTFAVRAVSTHAINQRLTQVTHNRQLIACTGADAPSRRSVVPETRPILVPVGALGAQVISDAVALGEPRGCDTFLRTGSALVATTGSFIGII